MLDANTWIEDQQRRLTRVAKQMKQEVVVNRSALDLGAFANRGGASAADAIFEGRVEVALGDLLEAAWQDAG